MLNMLKLLCLACSLAVFANAISTDDLFDSFLSTGVGLSDNKLGEWKNQINKNVKSVIDVIKSQRLKLPGGEEVPLNLTDRDLKAIDEIENIIESAEEDDGTINPIKLINKFLQDPMPIADFNISDRGAFSSIEGEFKNLELTGLKTLAIEKMKFQFSAMQMNVDMKVSMARLTGDYALDGQFTFFSLSGLGEFWMNVSELVIEAKTLLKINETGSLQVDDILLSVDAGDISLHFENLGGRWNTVLNQLSGLIFAHVKFTLLEEIEADVKDQLNEQLSQLPQGFLDGRSSTLFDELLSRTKKAINETGLDPFELPEISETFNHNVIFFVFSGELKIHKGILHGLTTITRAGEITVTYENDRVTLEALIGFDNLTGEYEWEARLMRAGPSGSAALAVSQIQAYVKISQRLKRGAPMSLDDFRIENIKNLWVDLNGIGKWETLINVVVNLVTNMMKKTLTNIIAGPVQDVVQQELKKMPISLI